MTRIASAALTRGAATPRQLVLTAAGLALTLAFALAPAGAKADTTTIGETTLTSAPQYFAEELGLDVPVFQARAEPGYVLASPQTGTVSSWSFRSAGIEPGTHFALRVLAPAGAGSWRGVATSDPEEVTTAAKADEVNGPFVTDLPIAAGDVIALQPTDGARTPVEQNSIGVDEISDFANPFADGSTASASTINNGQVVPVQAQVEYTPAKEAPTSAPPAPPAPTAEISTEALHGGLAFNSSGSSAGVGSIAGYTIKLDGTPEGATIHCPASSPVAIPRFARATSGTATLTVTSSDGQSATTSTPFSIAGQPGLTLTRTVHSAGIPTGTPDLISWECDPAPGSGPGASAPEAATGVNIDTSCSIDAGIVQAEGCGLQYESGLCAVPEPERGMIAARMVPAALARKFGLCGVAVKPVIARAHSAGLAGQLAKEESLVRSESDAFYVSTEPVRVNGLDLVPQPGSAIVLAVGGLIDTSFKTQYSVYLIGSRADVNIGGFGVLANQKLDLDVSGIGGASATVATFQLNQPVTLGRFTQLAAHLVFQSFGGVPTLPITGGFSMKFVPGGVTEISLNIQMNKLFSNPLDDAPFTGATTVDTSNSTGPQLEELNIDIPEISAGDAGELSPVKLHYIARTDFVSGSFGVGIDAAGGSVGGTLEFQGGDFKDGQVEYQADEGKGLQFIGPVYLIGASTGFSLYQSQIPGSATTISGQMILSVGPAINNHSCGVLDVVGNALINFYPGPFSLTANAQTRLFCIPFKESYFTVNSEGYVELGSNFDYEIPEIGDYKGNQDGQAYLSLATGEVHFQLDGSDSATIDGIGTVGVETVLSDRGLGACADVEAFGVHWHPGFGESFVPLPLNPEQFFKNLSLDFDGCSLSPYQSLGEGGPPHAARAGSAASGYSLSIPAGEQTAVVELHGEGGAPTATLTGPDGRTIDTTANSVSATSLVLRQPSTGTTLVEIKGQDAGRWTIAADPGSVPITAAYTAHELPPPHITAHVSGHGAHRLLHYRIRAQAGLSVSFSEGGRKGGQQLGDAHGLSGTIPFVPSDDAAGGRTIVADLTENGLPRPPLTVAHFSATPPGPGKVSAIRLARRGGGLEISFRPSPMAQRYLVNLSLGDGRAMVLSTKPGAHRLSVSEVAASVAVRKLSVIAIRNGLAGPAVVARLSRRPAPRAGHKR